MPRFFPLLALSLLVSAPVGAQTLTPTEQRIAAYVDHHVEDAITLLGRTASRGTAFGKTNVVAESTLVAGDLRFISNAQRERAKERMRSIVADHLPRTSAEIAFHDSYPAMAPNDGNFALLAKLDRVSRDLSYGPVEAVDPSRRGAEAFSYNLTVTFVIE